MRAVLVVPADNGCQFRLELRLVLGNGGLPQDFLNRFVEAFDHRDATVLPHGTISRQDVHRLAPHISEVLTVKLASLIDDQMLGLDSRANMIRPRAAVTSSDEGRFLKTANPIERRE